MDSILTDLKYAQSKQFLVNIFQKNQEVVYTGYVSAIDQTGLVIETFSDTGLPDGAVYLDLEVIEEVEFDSDDLDNMLFRIANAAEESLIDIHGITEQFTADQPLLNQVLTQALNHEWVLMIMDQQEGTFYEGQISKLTATGIELETFNKFNYSENKAVTLPFSAVKLVEFQGRELTLQALIMPEMLKQAHQPSVKVLSTLEKEQQLARALAQQTYIALIPDGNRQMFFVGKVNSINESGMVMNLVDMSGQFGGYVLLRHAEIREVITASDYLQTVNLLVQTNERIGTELQPVLNDERLFDATTDLFVSVLGQAAAFKRVLQIRLQDGQSMVGYPSHVTQDHVIFHEIEDTQIVDSVGQSIRIDEIFQIGFDYLEAHLIEQQLKNSGEL
ncbi:hypothetical protein LOSG293_190250 [Secundilactobacillus oryzae JCM 18671]|uniref:Uncharacterized protein n=1 Tax=Secundilactobacillus oryzae JCM 18671 TaxID=1291743 RepID=A0A081BJA0_9LACO|nr:hypothetical protein [Secundilactobacillus oryzae]GAK48118.1 hypothetical protein LOSG293_190250 [Secundilactobacillus oryzae JCM 18671]